MFSKYLHVELEKMHLFVINLEQAVDRRISMQAQMQALGLNADFHRAIDGEKLTPEQFAKVDREARRRLGLYPQANGSIANWLSQRQVMQKVVKNGPEMIAIFEDDALLSTDLPAVLAALELRPFAFDVVKLNRRSWRKTFIPCHQLTTGHRVGRIKYADSGSEGYVLTREAASHFLNRTPQMVREIDQSIPRFWESGLNVFYLDPPIVAHGGQEDSQIENDRVQARQLHKTTSGLAYKLWRRMVTGLASRAKRRTAFRRLLRGDIGVTPWP